MKINKLKINPEKSDGGVWIDWYDGARLKIARLNNPKHVKISQKLTKPYNNIRHNGGQIPNDKQIEIAAECLGRAVLLDWEGLEDDDGKQIPYSEEVSITLIKEIPDLADIVTQEAANNENFRIEALESASKNS